MTDSAQPGRHRASDRVGDPAHNPISATEPGHASSPVVAGVPVEESSLPPDAAARDAAKREEAGPEDTALTSAGFQFHTRGVSDEEQAAVIAVLTQLRAEETEQVRRVERREHQPWSRSQRVPQAFSDLLLEG